MEQQTFRSQQELWRKQNCSVVDIIEVTLFSWIVYEAHNEGNVVDCVPDTEDEGHINGHDGRPLSGEEGEVEPGHGRRGLEQDQELNRCSVGII